MKTIRTSRLLRAIARVLGGNHDHCNRKWQPRTLVVGPAQPVDGDSIASTKALIDHLRKSGRQAFTLPTLAMYSQIDWILSRNDIHPGCHGLMKPDLTTDNLQAAYDAVLAANWIPDEVVLVDGNSTGFDTRGVAVYTIDHHIKPGAAEVDNEKSFIKAAPSVGCILIEHFGIVEPILSVSILTDTFWFRQNNPAEAISHMGVLVANGLTNELLSSYQKRLMVHKDSSILAVMRESDMRFALEGEAAFVVLDVAEPELHRGVMAELGYFCHHMCVVRSDGYVSFRTTDDTIDLRPLAQKYAGGGHAKQAAGMVDANDSILLDQLFEDFVAVVAPAEEQSRNR